MMKKKFSLSVLCTTLLLLSYSCIEGFKDDTTYDPGVYNTTLESPEEIVFTASADGSTLLISWPVVPGAGGYEVTVMVVDDPENPDTLRHYSQLDATSTSVAFLDDTKYEAVVRSLGNDRYNNQTALEPTVEDYDTLVETYEIIASGTDLYAYFSSAKYPSSGEWAYDEIVYELEPNGNYTLSESLEFLSGTDIKTITLRGDKIYHPTVTYSEGATLRTKQGLKLKFIDFDCSAISSSGAFFMCNDEVDESMLIPEDNGTQRNFYLITEPIAVTGCNITGVNGYLVFADKAWVIGNLSFSDCQIQLNSTQHIIRLSNGWINSFNLQNSTVYNLQESSSRWMQFSNSARPAYLPSPFSTGTYTYANNTMVQIASSAQMANGGMNHASCTFNVSRNIFVDCGSSNAVSRYLTFNSNNGTRNYAYNCYWVGDQPQEQSGSGHDSTASVIKEDPGISSADVATGIFIPSQYMIDEGIGDPRWWYYEAN